jgi:hypothetical protein
VPNSLLRPDFLVISSDSSAGEKKILRLLLTQVGTKFVKMTQKS